MIREEFDKTDWEVEMLVCYDYTEYMIVGYDLEKGLLRLENEDGDIGYISHEEIELFNK